MAPSKTARLKVLTDTVFEIVDQILAGESEDIEAEEYALSHALIPKRKTLSKPKPRKRKKANSAKPTSKVLYQIEADEIKIKENKNIDDVFTKLDETMPTVQQEIEYLSDFSDHYKMSKTTVENLCLSIGATVSNQYTYRHGGRPGLTVTRQILLTIWLLVNQESFSLIAKRFSTSKSSALVSVRRVCDALVELSGDVITWPNEGRAQEIANDFQNECGIKGIIGIVDAIHIKVRAMEGLPESYKNSDGLPTIILQAICDNNLIFTDCYAGQLGSNSKAEVYFSSDFHQKVLTSPDEVFPKDYHLLGNLSYPLDQYLLTPFQQNFLNAKEETFNNCINKGLERINLAFAHLKTRFDRLNNLVMSRVDLVPSVSIAACVLHNMCIQAGDILDDSQLNLNTVCNQREKLYEYNKSSGQELNRDFGVQKRNIIKNNLYNTNEWY